MTNDARHSPGARPNDTPLSIKWLDPGRAAPTLSTRGSPSACPEGFDVRNGVTAAMTPVERRKAARGHCEGLPACNRPLRMVRSARSEQQGRGKDDGGTPALFENEPSGRAHDQNLRQRAVGFGDQHHDLIGDVGPPRVRSWHPAQPGGRGVRRHRAYPWP